MNLSRTTSSNSASIHIWHLQTYRSSK